MNLNNCLHCGKPISCMERHDKKVHDKCRNAYYWKLRKEKESKNK